MHRLRSSRWRRLEPSSWLLAAAVFLCTPGLLHASFERLAQPPSLVGRAMAGSAEANPDGTQNNPSALAGIPSLHIAIFHSPALFELTEVSHSGLSAAMPLPVGAAQLTMTRFGTELYREHAFMLTYAARLDETFAAGVSISYNSLSIERYGSAHAWGCDIGMGASPLPGLTIGASMLNVNRPTIGTESDELPRIFIVGMSYRLSAQARFAADMTKDVRFPESIHAGVEVTPLSFIALRTGISTAPSRFYGGLGLRLASVEFNYAVVTHQELGLTHSFGLTFNP